MTLLYQYGKRYENVFYIIQCFAVLGGTFFFVTFKQQALLNYPHSESKKS